MAEVAFDVVEQILVLGDVKNLIRFKSVCKLWRSLISSPRFIKAHLNHSYNHDRDNPELGHRRIWLFVETAKCGWFYSNLMYMVGSCNGLVCVSPLDVEFLVTNPLTREVKKPSMPPHMLKTGLIRQTGRWGFGYDSSADDYKIIVGFMESLDSMSLNFHALTLKSNTWKVIGEAKYKCYRRRPGILCGGALHWVMLDNNDNRVIISLDLSTDQFKEIPMPPPDHLYKDGSCPILGVIEDFLCIYPYHSYLSSKRWVMKNNKWELYNDHRCERKYDVAHWLTTSSYVVDDGRYVLSNGDYIGACIFVKSLVSPHPHDNNNNNNNYDGQIRNAKGKEGNESIKSGAKGCLRRSKRNKMR